MFGTVTRFNHDKGYGFILGEDGNTYFIHVSKLYGEYIDKGYYVFFKTYVTDRCEYNNISTIAFCTSLSDFKTSNNCNLSTETDSTVSVSSAFNMSPNSSFSELPRIKS